MRTHDFFAGAHRRMLENAEPACARLRRGRSPTSNTECVRRFFHSALDACSRFIGVGRSAFPVAAVYDRRSQEHRRSESATTTGLICYLLFPPPRKAMAGEQTPFAVLPCLPRIRQRRARRCELCVHFLQTCRQRFNLFLLFGYCRLLLCTSRL